MSSPNAGSYLKRDCGYHRGIDRHSQRVCADRHIKDDKDYSFQSHNDGAPMNPSSFLKFSHLLLSTSTKPYDYADTLHFPWSAVLIISFITILWIKQYIFKPLQCWVPQEYSKPWEEYAEYYCWISDTYYVPIGKPLPEVPARESAKLSYYQWVPFVLLVQSVSFWLPCVLWSLLSSRTSIPICSLIRASREATVADTEQRQRSVNYVARCLIDVLLHNCQRRRVPAPSGNFALKSGSRQFSGRYFCIGRKAGNYLALSYFLVKIAFLTNAAAQLYLVTIFTGTNYTFYGYDLIRDVIRGREWQSSGIFPRVTWCDFEVRTVGSLQRHSIMCVLPNNMLNEKIYIFLWWWFAFISIMTVLSVFVWMKRLVLPRSRKIFICKFLKYLEVAGHNQDKRLWQSFTNRFLRVDGVFILHLIADKAGEIIAGDIVCQMWLHFRQNGTDRRGGGGGGGGGSQRKMNGALPDVKSEDD